MKRLLAYWLGLAIGAMTPVAAAMAQEAEDTGAVARQAPVFDLQPGEQRPQPQPEVQGPRAPGMPAPRLLGQEDDTPPPVVTRPAPVPTQNDPAPATAQSDPQPAAERPATQPPARGQTTAASPGLEPQATPETQPSAIAESAPLAPVEPADATPMPASTPQGEEGMPWWIWLAGIFGLAALAALFLLRRKVRERAVEEQPLREPVLAKEPEPEPEAVPARAPTPVAKGPPTALPPAGLAPAAPTPAAQPPVASAQEDRPSRIEIDFVPLTARLSSLGLTLAYRLVLTNVSDETLSDIAVRLGIRSADNAAMATEPDAGEACVNLETLAPGEECIHSAQIRLDPKTYKPVQSDGKAMLVPIVDMMPRYRDADGVVHEMHATMLVGRELEPPRPKMQPFWLERGFGQFRGIGCRMLNVRTT
ncbi:hypothetical protein [Parasphingopyxis sp.]|uniref:hypothetical protein n=1 Tax=Parasphingopyxis sp. TaxID=1920299 RepID=UPI0026246108|nr:hypothetical protein [Parasphingopyxis sp.]